ncbi:MAG: hypothetical protein HYT73_01140 [Candidatus Aenigmarchaeota archaeon]|nr:hypothetical protein [Candidatus Aenigmarchaeota archaeon]
MEIECTARKVGNSIGIILPKGFVIKEGIKPSQNLRIEIKKQIKVKDVFGLFPEWKTPTQKLKDEARKGW